MTAIGDLTPRWGEISALLDEALALAPAERARWVETAPIEPAELRDTLRRLLQAQARVETGDFLATLAKLEPPGTVPSVAGEPAAGDAAGPYRLQREIGRGGMGAVWLAERTDGALKRQVALKLPRLAWDGAIAERLARERDILASLEHPHIARLYDAGVDAAGRPWLAMEYVDGQPIDVFCRERGLDTRARVRLLLDVAAAVAHAHRQQVLHRDLKPSNILVTADAQVRLLDFGVAKLMQGDRAAETALTRAAGRALTPQYASPEQIRGDTLSVASDVYSLGVVAYEVLAGDGPYRLRRGSAAEFEEAIVSAAPPPASSRAGDGATARALRGDLDAILNQALRKEPERRYVSVDAFAADLRRNLSGERVHARPDSLAYRAVRLWRQHALPIALTTVALAALAAAMGLGPTALLIVALAAGLGATAWQARRAFAQARATAQQAARADAVQQFLVELLGSAGFGVSSAEQRRATTVDQLLERAAQRLREHPSPDPQVQEALLGVVARLFQGLGVHAQAVALRRQLARRLDSRGAAPLERAQVHAAIGDALIRTDDVAGGIEAYHASLAALDGLSEPAAALARVHAQCRIGIAHHYIGNGDEGSRWIEAATSTPQWRQGDAVMRADVLDALCSQSARHGRIDEAETFMREAMHCDAEGREAMDPVSIERRVDLARLLGSRQRLGESEAEFRAALAVFDAAGEPDHPSAVRITFEFIKLLMMLGRLGEGLALIDRAAAAVERAPQRYPPLERQRMAQAQADLLLENGRIEEAARPVAAGVDAMCESVEPAESTIAMGVKARFLVDTGRFDEAKQCLERSLALRTSMFGPWHRLTLVNRNRIVMVALAQGHFEAALAALDELLSQAPADAAPPWHYGTQRDVAGTLRAQCLLELQRPSEALAAAQEQLQRHLHLPANERPALTEITLRLLAARSLIALQRVDDAWPHLHALDELAHTLYERHPQRAAVRAAWAQALAQSGRIDEARAHLQQADSLLATQPSLGPQFRRYPGQVWALLDATDAAKPSATAAGRGAELSS
jgi:serine/threonine-protein kinase